MEQTKKWLHQKTVLLSSPKTARERYEKSRTMCGLPLWKTFSLYWILFAENFTGHEKEEIRKGRNMQDEVNEKVVSLCIRGGKISAQILKSALLKTLTKLEQQKSQRKQKKGVSKEEKNLAVYKGKQSMEKLKEQNCELSNIEITDGNIKSFEKYARKYNVDYCLKKDRSSEPPRYYVFFKARDVDSMTAAFKEYTGWSMKKSKKISIRKKLSKVKERQAQQRERQKTKRKERDTAR